MLFRFTHALSSLWHTASKQAAALIYICSWTIPGGNIYIKQYAMIQLSYKKHRTDDFFRCLRYWNFARDNLRSPCNLPKSIVRPSHLPKRLGPMARCQNHPSPVSHGRYASQHFSRRGPPMRCCCPPVTCTLDAWLGRNSTCHTVRGTAAGK